MILAIVIILSLFFPMSFITKGEDYRPSYNFSADVFKELPAFPIDFQAKKKLFDGQKIVAEQLTPEYYLQPEIMPGWNQWKDQIFGGDDIHWTGIYGVSIYPSRFDIFNIKINDTARVSAILSPALGVEVFQGLQLELIYNHSALSIKQISPENTSVLLEPTYPYFYKNWSQIIVFELRLLAKGDYTVLVYEELPARSLDTYWKEKYKPLYTAGGSILGMTIPKMKICVHGPVNETPIIEKPVNKGIYSDGLPYLIGLLLMLITCCIIGGVYAIKKRQKKISEEKVKT